MADNPATHIVVPRSYRRERVRRGARPAVWPTVRRDGDHAERLEFSAVRVGGLAVLKNPNPKRKRGSEPSEPRS